MKKGYPRKDRSIVENWLVFLLGYMTRNGATEEERRTVIQAIYLERKYSPFYKNRKKKEEG